MDQWLLLWLALTPLRLGQPVPDYPELRPYRGELDVVLVFSADRRVRAPVAGAFAVGGERVPGIATWFPARAGRPLALLIDRGGILRAVSRTADAQRVLQTYRDGRESYDVTCARCHGADGGAVDYPHIKRLTGAGNRLTEAQIRTQTRAVPLPDGSYMVRGTVFPAERLAALVQYVAGL